MSVVKQNDFKMVAKTFFGLEDILENELLSLGAKSVKKGIRSVSFYGDKGFMYKANLNLRTALFIYKTIKISTMKLDSDIYSVMKNISWQKYMNVNQSFSIKTTVSLNRSHNSMYFAQKAKDGLVDKFRDLFGKRPNVDKKFPDIHIHLYINEKTVEVSLNSSGSSLHQRGYRLRTNIAPINEVLAAGLILLSQWDKKTDFFDPMCGSATLLIEAAMIACSIPPSLNRKIFAFQNWIDWDNNLYTKIEDSLVKKIKDLKVTITGMEKSPSAIIKAKQNLKNANLEDFIVLKKFDFFKSSKINVEKPLQIVFNPPYGERLPVDVESFYSSLGNTLKKNYPNSNAWFLTSNLQGIKFIGLRPSRKIKLFNGKLESRLLNYKLYKGSKKQKKQ